jgi:hypothetical protein
MKAFLESLGLAAVARRTWPRVLADLRIDDLGGEGSGDPPTGVPEPRPGVPPGARSAGVALEEPRDTPLADVLGRQR